MFKAFKKFCSHVDELIAILYRINNFLMTIDENAHNVTKILQEEQAKLKLLDEKEKFLNADN